MTKTLSIALVLTASLAAGQDVRNVARQQLDLAKSPLGLVKSKKNAFITAAVAGSAIAFIATRGDSKVASAAYGNPGQKFESALSGNATKYAMVSLPAVALVSGILRRDSYDTQTAMIAGQALGDAWMVSEGLKLAARRFQGPGFQSNLSSTHAASAWALATVFARRYGKQHAWVRPVAYGAAAAISVAVVASNSHYASDSIIGSGIGFGLGSFLSK